MFYYIQITGNACKADIIVNGLRVSMLKAEKGGNVNYPFNTELIDNKNTIEIVIYLPSFDVSTLDRLFCDGTVKTYEENEFVGPDSGTVVAQFSMVRKIEDLKNQILDDPTSVSLSDEFPFTMRVEFVCTNVPTFSDRLIHAPIIDNEDSLKDWAMIFRNYLINQDVQSLYTLYKPKLIDYDRAYPNEREPDNAQWFSDWMNDTIFPEIPFTDFTRDDVIATKWCDGRMWELTLNDGRALWTTIGKNNQRSRIEVFVGNVSGAIKMIR